MAEAQGWHVRIDCPCGLHYGHEHAKAIQKCQGCGTQLVPESEEAWRDARKKLSAKKLRGMH